MKTSNWIIVYVVVATLSVAVVSIQTRRVMARQAIPTAAEIDTDRAGELQRITLQQADLEREYFLRLPNYFRSDGLGPRSSRAARAAAALDKIVAGSHWLAG